MKRSIRSITILILVFTLALFPTTVFAAENQSKPPIPTLVQDITESTEGSVHVTINNWGNAVTKEYRIDSGSWQNYKAPIELKDNATVYARGKNAAGVYSDTGSLIISNIRRLLSKTDVSKQSISTVKIVTYDVNDNEIGTGSGFIVSPDGQVVTNYHVIDMAPKLKVVTSEDKTYDVLGVTAYDVSRDLAVIRLKDAQNLPAVKLGDSAAIKLGEDVVAIGYPLDIKVTVSFGNISSLDTPGGLLRTSRSDIQITAPISPGSSGGPLFNMYGEVVGINYSTMVNAQNMNFSIPVNELKPLLASKNLKMLTNVIWEVYPKMDYNQYEDYLFYNYPDAKSGDYTFSFNDIYMTVPSDTPGELDVYLDLNSDRYGEILMAEFEGNKQAVEKWLDDIYMNVKAKFPDKDVYIVAELYGKFNTRLEGYTDKQAIYDSKTGKWEICKVKVVHGLKNGSLGYMWF